MKKICLFGALFTALTLAAATRLGPFEIDESGRIQVENLTFHLTCADSNWGKWVHQEKRTVALNPGMPSVSADRVEISGTYRISGGNFALQERVKKLGENSISVEIDLASDKGVAVNSISYSTELPIRIFGTEGIRIDGKKFTFPAGFDEKKWQFSAGGEESTLELPLPAGLLTIRGNFQVFLQDERKYGYSHWSLRLFNGATRGVIRRKSYRLTMTLTPYRFRTVSLGKAANLDFRDEVAGDGKGGWSDQGPDNDLRSFPVRQCRFAGVEFDVADPSKNNGRAVIGLYCKPHAPAYPKSIRVAADGKKGKYLYLLHALAWEPKAGTVIGTLDVAYADGTGSAIELAAGRDVSNFWRPRKQKNAAIGWYHANNSAEIGIFVSRFPLENKPVKALSFNSSGKGIWLIAGATFSDDIVPMAEREPLVMRANHDWRPFRSDKMVRKNSILDFSELLDAPAGKYGFLRAAGTQFEFEKRPGKPVRLFGGNIAFTVNFMRNELCDKLGDFMAGMGYNFLRLHHFDGEIAKVAGKTSTALNPKPLERMDYMISAMKKRGIYITLDLYTLRKLAKGEVDEFPELALTQTQFKAMPFISESAMRSWETFSANLLNHVNPYTGLAWKDDPAIVTISLINEDTIFAIVNSDPRVTALYRAKFEEYARKKKIALTDVNRDLQWKLFLSETYSAGYRRMAKFLRGLGVKALLTDQNMWSKITVSLLRADYDLVDNHYYWQHPVFVGKGWQLPMLIGGRSAIAACGGTLSSTFPSRLFGKPFTVSEWDFCNPSPYVTEGFFMTGAYASLQNWAGLCHFTISHSAPRVENADSLLNLFDIINDPLRQLAQRGAVLFYLRGDVSPAADAYPFLISSSYLADGNTAEDYPDVLARLGLIGRVGTVIAQKGSNPVLPAGTRAVLGMEPAWNKARLDGKPFVKTAGLDETLRKLIQTGAVPSGLVDLKNHSYTSSTREIALNRNANTFQVTTPRSECFVLPAGKTLSGKYATVENRYSYGSFLVAARDGRALAESRRVLILHLTDSKNTESRYTTDDFTQVESWGKLPILLKRGEAVITLRAPAGLRLYACRLNGERIGEVPFRRVGGAIRFDAKNLAGNEPVLVYELAD